MWLSVGLVSSCVVILFYSLLNVGNILYFWMVLELLSLGVAPFFLLGGSLSSLRGVYHQLVVASLSSVFILIGAIVHPLETLMVGLGVLIKLAVFPFMGWAYEVVGHSNWVVTWFISGILKVPFVLFIYCGISGSSWGGVVCLLVSIGWGLVALNFWNGTGSWKECWCHMMIVSSGGLVVISLGCCSLIVYLVYGVYMIWSSLVIFFFPAAFRFSGWGGVVYMIFYLMLLISFPLSLSLIYKVVMSLAMICSSFWVLFVWCLCSVSEQLYLMRRLIESGSSRDKQGLSAGV